MSFQIKVLKMNKIVLFLTFLTILILQISCSEKQDVLDVGTHPDAWTNKSSEKFHGNVVLESGKEQCADCHGTDFQGGKSGVSCFNSGCHLYYPHPAGFAELSSSDFHGEYLKSKLNWDMVPCQACHGSNYAGGSSGVSCKACHIGPAGPEECNTCHGNEINNAPPQDLSNNVSSDSVGVGAHQKHVANTLVTNVYDCNVCHMAVLSFNAVMHIDDTPFSEVLFDTLGTDDGRLNAQWSHNSASCNEVYCHGGFLFKKSESSNPFAYTDSVIVGNQAPIVWTQKNEDTCNFCHGLPPTGHIAATPDACANCHTSVVNSDGEIIDKNKHINGKINVFNN